MSRPTRRVVAPSAVAAVVAAALFVGEHGETDADEGAAPPSAPRIVTPEEFCAGFGELVAAREAVLQGAADSSTRVLEDAASAVGELAEGTAMSDDARAGVVYLVTAFLSLDDDATAQDVVEVDDLATVGDSARADALAAYIGESCGRPSLSGAK